MTPLDWLAVAVGGALGAPTRYLLDGFVQERAGGVFPAGTFAVNVAGSFVLGVVAGLALYHGFSGAALVLVATGFCGALTTFSTFTYETVRLVEEGTVDIALRNVGFSVAAGLAAAVCGLVLTAVI